MNPPAVDRWIGDYRSVGLVEWPDDLRDSMSKSWKRPRFWARFWIVACPVMFVVGLLLGIFAVVIKNAGWSSAADVALGIGGVMMVIGFVALPFFLLLGRDAFRLSSTYRKALREPQVEMFVRSPHVDEEAAVAATLGLASDLSGVATSVYLAPRAGLLVGVQFETHLKPITPPLPQIVATLSVPASRLSTEQPPTPESDLIESIVAPNDAAPRMQILNAHELAEIATYRRSIGSVKGWVALGVSAAFVGMGVTAFILGTIQWWHYIALGLWGLALAAGIRNVLLSYPARRRLRAALRRDLEGGSLELLPWSLVREELLTDGARHEDLPAVPPEFVERLPASKLVWSLDGIPAPWRRA